MIRRLLLVTFSLLAGCSPVGVFTHKVFGPPSVEAKYILKKVPTLIFIENYRHGSAMQFDCESLMRAVVDEFEKKKIVPLVEVDRIYLLKDNDPKAFRAMPTQQIGKACGAEQIVYIDLLDLSVGGQGARDDARGQSATRVRVIDANTGRSVWPTDAADGYPVIYSVQVRAEGQSFDSVRGKVLTGMADRIARLFYKYKPDEVPD